MNKLDFTASSDRRISACLPRIGLVAGESDDDLAIRTVAGCCSAQGAVLAFLALQPLSSFTPQANRTCTIMSIWALDDRKRESSSICHCKLQVLAVCVPITVSL